MTKTTNEFSKVSGYKVNIQNLIVLYYISSNQLKNKNLKTIPIE